MKRTGFGIVLAAVVLVLFGCQNASMNSSKKHLKSDKEITAFGFGNPVVEGIINGTDISVTVPYGTAVTALTATFTTTGDSVRVGSEFQVSGKTVNDFSFDRQYTVEAEDGTEQNYTVTVTIGAKTAVTLDSGALGAAYQAYSGALTELATITATLDSTTNEYVLQNANGSVKGRYAMNLSNPMLIVGAYTFSNYVSVTSGYTVNGTLSYIITNDSENVSVFYYKGALTYTGGAVSGLSLEYSLNGATLSGTMTVDDTTYDIASYAVNFAPAAAAPTFSVASGAYSTAQSVTLSCATAGARIFYTVDGTVPTSSSTEFTGTAVTVSASMALRAIAIKDGMPASIVSMGGYVFGALSGNSALASLTADAGSLSPAFSSSITNYSLSVENSITTVKLQGTASDTNAAVSGSVTLSNLVVGIPQTASITVTAANGTTTVYKVSVTRSSPAAADGNISVIDPAALTITLSGQSATLSKAGSWTLLAIPSNSVESWSWYLDGSAISGALTDSITINGSSLTLGPHSVMVIGLKTGRQFSASCYFAVQ